jgi:hypothetical protein
MTSPPRHGSRPPACVPRPARHPAGPPDPRQRAGRSARLTFWLHSPYQGLRRGYRCPSGALTTPGARSVHGSCATDERRGTNLLAGHRRAHTVKAGVRTPVSGERADGGPRTGRAPDAGEATPAHAPARPLVNGRRGGTASTRPARPAPGPRAESANTRLTARHAARVRPRPGGPVPAASLTIFRLPRVRPGAKAGFGMRGDRHGSRAERHLSHDFACQPASGPANPPDGYPAGDPALQTCRHTCRPRPGRSRWPAAEYTCGGEPGLMTRSSNNHPRGAGTGAGIGISAARDEAAVLTVAAHLTDRDRDLVRLVARHRVLTTDQLTALRFSNLTTARHRLTVLVRLGLLRRFRPHRDTGSAPWHYVLGPVGAALLGQEDRDERKWAPQVRADRQLALERSQRLDHMTGTSWFFASLARHARKGGGELAQWLNEAETVTSFNHAAGWADIRSRFPNPDGAGTWAADGRQLRFLLEYDTGTENLPALTGKLDGYQALASAMAWNDQMCPVVLFCFTSARREQSARRALAATREASALRIATAAIDPRTTRPAGPVWLPLLTRTASQVSLIDLDDALPDPWHAYRQDQARKRREVAESERKYRVDQEDEDWGTAHG